MKLWGRKEENKYNRFIRERIIEARKEKGMTQEELAKALDTSREVISNIETGRTEINAVDLMGIAYILEKPVRYFYPQYVPTENDLSSEEWELIHYFRKIQNEALEKLLIRQAREFAEISDEVAAEQTREEHQIVKEEYAEIDIWNAEERKKADERIIQRLEEAQARRQRK